MKSSARTPGETGPETGSETASQIRTLTRDEVNHAHTLAWRYFLTLGLPQPPVYLRPITYYYDPARQVVCSFVVETTPRLIIHVNGPHEALSISHQFPL